MLDKKKLLAKILLLSICTSFCANINVFADEKKTSVNSNTNLTTGQAIKLENQENDLIELENEEPIEISETYLNPIYKDLDINFEENQMTVIGKGNKERTIYLNKACVKAINDYLAIRPKEAVKKDSKNSDKALFLSERRQRISRRMVQEIIYSELKQAGIDSKKYSVHKLRHTAATLMYQYGGVDIRALQELLGHESISTTEIYTHVSNEQVRNAVESNPLADE